ARQLIANAGLSPTANALYKVYIIDEVHMLSGAAFNALLKTMEEPPSHVKFILCTTEPHKVPATIQSRCQRFDFRNIATAKIADHLGEVLKNENVEAEGEVVWQVARLGNGSMRDALSLMDRLLATGESPLTAKTLQDMLGLPDHELIAALVDALATGDVKASLTGTAGLLNRGIGQDQLVEVVIERLRQLMLLCACGPDSDLIELSEDAKPKAIEQAQRFDAAGLVHMIALCENLQRFGKTSSNPRALLDATVVRLALAEKMADVSAVLAGHAPGTDEKKKLAGDRPTNPGWERGEAAGRRLTSIPNATSLAAADPNTQPPTPHSPPDANNPQAVWRAVLDAVGQSNAAAWMDQFRLQSVDTQSSPGRAVLATSAGFVGGAHHIATPPRLKRVADTLRQLLGRPFEVSLAEADPAAARARQLADPPTGIQPDTHSATQAQKKNSGGGGSGGHVDRRDALDL
ncbi:MAG: AAA family ATPase, partial [Planctomycetota bacterium]